MKKIYGIKRKYIPESKLVVRLVVVGAGGCLASPVAFASAAMAASVLLLTAGEVNDSDSTVSPADCCCCCCCAETINIGEDQVKVKVSKTDVK